MERSTKKTKTIQMKYPAQYSQSWNEEKLIKPKKTGKGKKTHTEKETIHEPMIYSRSWPKEKVNKKSNKRPDSPTLPLAKTYHHKIRRLRKEGYNSCTRTVPRFRVRERLSMCALVERICMELTFSAVSLFCVTTLAKCGLMITSDRSSLKVNRAIDPFSEAWGSTKEARLPDPTAPHLKYGLFPPTRRGMNNAQAQVLLAGTGTACKATRSETSSVEFFSRKNVKRNRHFKGNPDDSHSRLFMFQPTGSRRLTISKLTHLDIRPRYGRRQLNHQND